MWLQKVISRKIALKNYFFAGILKVNDENIRIRIQEPDPDPGAGSGSESESGSVSISQRHGSVDQDPDPPQNVMDPQHWILG